MSDDDFSYPEIMIVRIVQISPESRPIAILLNVLLDHKKCGCILVCVHLSSVDMWFSDNKSSKNEWISFNCIKGVIPPKDGKVSARIMIWTFWATSILVSISFLSCIKSSFSIWIESWTKLEWAPCLDGASGYFFFFSLRVCKSC